MGHTYRKAVSILMLLLMIQFQVECVFAGSENTNAGPTEQNNPDNNDGTPSPPLQADNTYPFIAGDAIEINAFPDTSSFLNGVFPIDDKGNVEFPIIGKVNVVKMSVSELKEFLKTQFKAYLRYPNILVKPMIRMSVLGGVTKPGLYYFDKQNSLWEVMRLAGGTKQEDGLKKLRWERDRDEVVDDLIPYFQSGMSLHQMGFKSGDQLWTPSEPTKRFSEIFFAQIVPLITFVTTIFLLYWDYQVQVMMIESGRFNW